MGMQELQYPASLCEEETVFVKSTLESGDLANAANLSSSYFSDPRTNFWVAESTNEHILCGCVGLRRTADADVGDIGRLTECSVPSRGVGAKLLHALEVHAKAAGLRSVTATTVSLNLPALRTYAAQGYKEIFRGRKDGKENDPAFVKVSKDL